MGLPRMGHRSTNASSEVFEGYQPPAIEVLARVRVTGTTLAIDDSPGDHDFSRQSSIYDKTFEIPATAFLTRCLMTLIWEMYIWTPQRKAKR